MFDQPTIEIQIQDIGGNWITVQTTQTNDDRYVYSLMEQAQRNFQGKRTRALENGRLKDVLQ